MIEQKQRLATGGLIDRTSPLTFQFNGKRLGGFAGDTLASALVANGVSLVGRSFKYHRPRGIFSAGAEEPNALMTLGSGPTQQPNSRATVTELYDGLAARSQNHVGPLGMDLMAMNDWLSPFLSAGFYYKTFMWPRAFWERVYEPMIRNAAGLGKLSGHPDDAVYNKGFLHCDMLVIGSGPAGLMAAKTAAQAGLRVIMAEQDFAIGGSLLACDCEIDSQPGATWAQSTLKELLAHDNVRVMTRTSVFGTYDHGVYGALEQTTVGETSIDGQAFQTLWRIYSKHCIVATGATERPVAFGDNDRPGVMLAGAVETYLNRFAATPGQRVLGFGPDQAALARLKSACELTNVECYILAEGQSVTQALGARRVAGARLSNNSTHNCDLIAVAGGWNPNVHLTSHHRGRPVWSDQKMAFVPGGDLPSGQLVAGAANGDFGLLAAMQSGLAVAGQVCEHLGKTAATLTPSTNAPTTAPVPPLWAVPGVKGRAWVDLQNDVTTKDIKLAHQEGFKSVEHLKRYTTLGMATDQGKTSNVSGVALMAQLTGQSIQDTGTTMFRPPFQPVAMGAFGGRSRGKDFKPTRLAPTHQWASEQGAVFVETGNWLRAQWFPKDGETHWRQSVDREVLATRNHVGICDVSTLGKIDVQGRDAATFLNRVYANAFGKLAIGKVRYGLMLREDGIVMDDGTTARLGDHHFVMTTTTANAALVFRHIEFCRQCLWPDLDVHVVSTTDAWAQLAIAGPKSRALLQRIVDDPDQISNEAFPFMACRELSVCGGTSARLFRISFSGEMAYELAVPTRYGDALVRRLMTVGHDLGVTPYGTEALGVMRIEKGHPAGNELNGQTTALNLNLDGLVSSKKESVGRTMSRRQGLRDPDGLRLVGLRPVNPAESLTAGSHFVAKGEKPEAANDLGYMTSVAYSPILEHSIGLGLIKQGTQRHGDIVRAVDLLRGTDVDVEIVSAHFVDPQGSKLRD